MAQGLLSQLPIIISQEEWPFNQEVDPEIYVGSSWPKISIVTPSFNQGKFLEKTIRSVLLQNYPNLEFIIIDGGSSDNSVEILSKYASFLTYWVSEPDKGQSDALNKGIGRCTGEIFNWLNSDDYLAPDAFFFLGNLFREPRVEVVLARYWIHDLHSGRNFIEGTHLMCNPAKTAAYCRLHQPASYFRFSAFKKLLPLSQDLHFTMDYELWITYLLTQGQTAVVLTEAVAAHFLIHPQSKSGGQNWSRFFGDELGIFYALATHYQLNNVVNFLERQKNWPVLKQYTLKKKLQNLPLAQVKQVCAYFLLRSAELFYGEDKFQEALFWAKSVDSEALTEPDQKLLNKILFRSRFLWPLVKLGRLLRK